MDIGIGFLKWLWLSNNFFSLEGEELFLNLKIWVSLLFFKLIRVREGMLKRVEERVLVKVLWFVLKVFKLESIFMFGGSVFLKWLLVSDKNFNFVRLSSGRGKLLLIILEFKCKLVSCLRLINEDGIWLLSLLEERLRWVRWKRFLIEEGICLLKKLFESLRINSLERLLSEDGIFFEKVLFLSFK